MPESWFFCSCLPVVAVKALNSTFFYFCSKRLDVVRGAVKRCRLQVVEIDINSLGSFTEGYC